MITKLGHKDDAIAQKAAWLISKSIKKPVCVIAGVHLDNITKEEIDKLLENAGIAVEKFINLKRDDKKSGRKRPPPTCPLPLC